MTTATDRGAVVESEQADDALSWIDFDVGAVGDERGGSAGADHRRDAELACDYRGVAKRAAAHSVDLREAAEPLLRTDEHLPESAPTLIVAVEGQTEEFIVAMAEGMEFIVCAMPARDRFLET